MQNYKTRDFERLLRNNGFRPIRQKGSHKIFINENRTICIPASDVEVNAALGRKIIKDYKLV